MENNNLNTQPTETVMEIKPHRRRWRLIRWSLAIIFVLSISLLNKDIAMGSKTALVQIIGSVSNFSQSVTSMAREALFNVFGGGSEKVVQTIDVNSGVGYASVVTSLLSDNTTEEKISGQSTETSKTAITNKTKTTTIKSDEAETISNNKQDKVAKLPEENKKTESPVVVSKSCSFISSQSPSHSGVILNEVSWMGGSSAFGLTSTDEWIELKNISNTKVNLSGWQILDKAEQIKIVFDGLARIPANGFYLLERTDDDSVPNIAANLIYANTLNNADEGLRLFDNQCNLIDEVLADSDWPAGDKVEKRTMERSPDLSWHTYNGTVQNNIFGTPKKENSTPTIIVSGNGNSGGAPANNQPTTNTPTTPINSPSKILISEIQISPIGNRFIELYNPNSSSVNLTDWYLQRKTKIGSSFGPLVSKTYFEGKIINANSYFLISRDALENTDIALNNLTLTGSNTIQLKNSNGEVADKIGWGQASDCESNCASELLDSQSLQRKSFIDTDNNANDFEIQTCPSPKARLGTCQASQTNSSAVLTINQAPSAFFVYAPSNPYVGDSITFNASSSTDSDGSIVSYQWNFGDNATSITSITATSTYSYSSAGNYIVQLIVFDNQNISSGVTSAISILDSAPPSASVVAPIITPPITSIDYIVISEIQVAGVTADDEFIKIYNPTPLAIDLSILPLKLHIRTSTGTDYNRALTFINTTIPAYSFFLIGPAAGYTGSINLDITYSASGNKLVNNGGVYISTSITAEVNVIDKVGWGTQPSGGFESVGFTKNPSANQSLKRKFIDNLIQDTNNNADDFIF